MSQSCLGRKGLPQTKPKVLASCSVAWQKMLNRKLTVQVVNVMQTAVAWSVGLMFLFLSVNLRYGSALIDQVTPKVPTSRKSLRRVPNTMLFKKNRFTRKRKSEDTEEAVASKRRDQGPHECEVMNSSFDADEGGIKAWEGCQKNPGHSGFISAPNFKIKHLPKEYREACVMECIQNVAACTGRLSVNYTSWARPDNYTFAIARGTTIQHTGTAYAYRVTPGKGHCPCPYFKGHDTPQKQWWKINLQTACHVVYNSEEAKSSKVDLYYDDERAGEDGRMRTLYGLEVVDRNESGDRCELICATHDQKLVKELLVQIDKSRSLFNALSIQSAKKAHKGNLCVVVSHPHGMHKHITVGRMKGRIKMNGIGRRKFTYTTKTCPGSSGAPIIMPLGVTFWPVKSPWMAPHSSAADDGEFSKSGEGDVWWL